MNNELSNSEKILAHVLGLLKYCKEKEQEKLLKKNKPEYVQKCGNKFKSLLNQCPTLFYKIIDNPHTFELNRLIQMLNLKNKVDNKEVTHKDASEELGEKYYSEFVKPIIPEDEKE